MEGADDRVVVDLAGVETFVCHRQVGDQEDVDLSTRVEVGTGVEVVEI